MNRRINLLGFYIQLASTDPLKLIFIAAVQKVAWILYPDPIWYEVINLLAPLAFFKCEILAKEHVFF